MKLIENWRQAWRLASVQAAALLAVLSAIQSDVIPHVQPLIAEQHWPWVSGGLAVAIAVLRLISQPAAHGGGGG